MAAFVTILSIASYAGLVYTIPPPQCFANFRWDDCGKEPKPVIYYWKTGSRCEVGIWRGCLPNINMFKDEYECVTTCVFTVRAAAQDWHNVVGSEEDITSTVSDYDHTGTPTFNSTAPDAGENATVAGNVTEVSGGTTGDVPPGDTSTGGGETTGASGEVTTNGATDTAATV